MNWVGKRKRKVSFQFLDKQQAVFADKKEAIAVGEFCCQSRRISEKGESNIQRKVEDLLIGDENNIRVKLNQY